jgi:hypothetical protein
MKSIGNTLNYSLLAIWIIGLASVLFLIVSEISQNAFTGKDIEKVAINIKPSDTLNIKFISNNLYSKNNNDYENFEVVHNELDQEIIFSNNVSIKIVETEINHMKESINKLNSELSSNILLRMTQIKKEYLDDLKKIIENNEKSNKLDISGPCVLFIISIRPLEVL